MEDELFLGSGARFPFAVNPATGRVEVSAGQQNVKESLFLILKTAIGERILRPGFGTNLNSFSFMDVTTTMLQILRRDLSQQIYENEPRIASISLNVDPSSQEGTVLFLITYTVRDTNTQENLVFPFYLNGENAAPTEEKGEPEFYDFGLDDLFEDGEIDDE